ncbi:MAG: hypothetical protein PHU31_05455 [Anaerotignum sp.]|nr:hypothetical protein [Anaerotignum sp.]
MEKINPEMAAHNIAMILCKKFYDTNNDKAFRDTDKKEFYGKATQAAKLYALVYDAAFKEISSNNKEAYIQ